MGYCGLPRRLTKRLLFLPAILLVCLFLRTALYSLFSVSVDLSISQKTLSYPHEPITGMLTGDQASHNTPENVIRLHGSPDVLADHNKSTKSIPSGVLPVHLPTAPHSTPGALTDALLKSPVPSSEVRQQKVLLVAYYRSGSTLTGSFFDHQPGTFYVFEPLHASFKNCERRRRMPYFDGSVRSAPRWDELNDISLEILPAFFNCDLETIDWYTITSGFGSKSTAYGDYIQCVRNTSLGGSYMQKIRKNCLPGLIQKCRSSKAIVVKTIRLRMALAEELLKVIPDLKIVHLMRDPRGMACSLQRRSCLGALSGVGDMCERLTSDVALRQTLQKQYPERVYTIKYESLIQFPLRTVVKMFQFIGLLFHSDVANWMYGNLFSGHQDSRPLSTTKSNSIATAFNWTSRIHWDVVNRYQKTCSGLLGAEEYPVFRNLADVKNFRTPIVNTTEQIAELKQLLPLGYG